MMAWFIAAHHCFWLKTTFLFSLMFPVATDFTHKHTKMKATLEETSPCKDLAVQLTLWWSFSLCLYIFTQACAQRHIETVSIMNLTVEGSFTDLEEILRHYQLPLGVTSDTYNVSLCVKRAIKALSLKVDDLLVDIYYHFHTSANKMTSLQDYASTEYKPARWLSLSKVMQCTFHM